MKKNLGLTLAVVAVLSFSSIGNQAHAFKIFPWKKDKAEQTQAPVAETVQIEAPAVKAAPAQVQPIVPVKQVVKTQPAKPVPAIKKPCPMTNKPCPVVKKPCPMTNKPCAAAKKPCAMTNKPCPVAKKPCNAKK